MNIAPVSANKGIQRKQNFYPQGINHTSENGCGQLMTTGEHIELTKVEGNRQSGTVVHH